MAAEARTVSGGDDIIGIRLGPRRRHGRAEQHHDELRPRSLGGAVRRRHQLRLLTQQLHALAVMLGPLPLLTMHTVPSATPAAHAHGTPERLYEYE